MVGGHKPALPQCLCLGAHQGVCSISVEFGPALTSVYLLYCSFGAVRLQLYIARDLNVLDILSLDISDSKQCKTPAQSVPVRPRVGLICLDDFPNPD